MQRVYALIVGLFFGIVLVKSEVVSWFRIQKMFRFEEPTLYLIIGSAVVVGIASLWLIRRLQVQTVQRDPVKVSVKPFQKGVIIGGVLFGLGWAITGACPGPIYAQIGSGEYAALITFGAAMVGMYLYALLQPRLPH